MIHFKQAAVLAAFVASSAAAVAAPVSVAIGSGSILATESLTFSVNVGASPTASFTAAIRGTGVVGDVFSLSLYNSANQLVSAANTLDVVSPFQKKEVFTNFYTDLAAGAYTLKLAAGINGGAYTVSGSYNLPASPVPEPLPMALSLAGVVAVLMSRRKAR